MKVRGVKKVVQVPSGVAVVAENTWAAMQGREALEVDWEPGKTAGLDSDKLLAEWKELSKKPGQTAVVKGDAAAALAKAAKKLEAVYDVPYLAHSPMEPLNATVKLDRKGAEIWVGTQAQTIDQAAAAEILGLKPEQVKLHTMFLGGGFGRRATRSADFTSEAVHVAKAAGAPVKTVWTREDDTRGGYYRPMFVHRMEAGLDAAGKPVAWRQTIVGQSLGLGPPGGIDSASVEGASNAPYLAMIPAHSVTLHSPDPGIPVLWWRAVGSTHTAFAVECFLDEIAHAAKRDPVELRREMLKEDKRSLRVMEAAVEKAGWFNKPAAGIARGIAVHESFGSHVAEVAEVSVEKDRIRVHRVVCAIDCGLAVNPDGVVAQMQGGILYGLGPTLYSALSFKDGRVQEGNFDDYKVARITDAPKIEVVIVPSDEKMGGAGEPGTPPIAPAVANAVFSLTGKRLRSLPLKLS